MNAVLSSDLPKGYTRTKINAPTLVVWVSVFNQLWCTNYRIMNAVLSSDLPKGYTRTKINAPTLVVWVSGF